MLTNDFDESGIQHVSTDSTDSLVMFGTWRNWNKMKQETNGGCWPRNIEIYTVGPGGRDES